MLRNSVFRQVVPVVSRASVFPRYGGPRFYSASEFGGKKDSGFNIMNFVVVALVGTGIFGVVVHKVDQQDASKSMMKRKNSYSDQEWEQYMNSIKRKVLLFKPSTDVYAIPNPKAKEVEQLSKKLSNVKIVDLNDIIEDELQNHSDRYGTLLQGHLVSDKNGIYEFDSRLAKGIFTKLMRLRLETLKNEPDSQDCKYILKNFPNNLQEAIKFESDVAIVKKLVLFDDQKSDISDYFETVKKVARVKKITDATVKQLQEE